MESRTHDKMQLTVLTYNIRKGKGPLHGGGSIPALAAGLAECGADLVLCQEVFHTWDGTGARQSDELAEVLSLIPCYGPNAKYRRGHHGNATLTRFALKSHFNRDLSTNPFEKRGVLYSLVETEFGHLHVFNTHLGLNNRQRKRQVQWLAETIDHATSDGAPVLLAGDFNDWTGGLDQEIVRHCQLENALSVLSHRDRKSWPSYRPLFGLDRIYFRGLDLVSARVLTESPWERLSDHFPVAAVFSLIDGGSAT